MAEQPAHNGSVLGSSPSEPTSFPLVGFPEIDELSFYWLAGLLEGEGSFRAGIPTEPNNPRVVIGMTDEDVIAKVARLLGVGYSSVKPKQLNWKLLFVTLVRGRRAITLMTALLPLMSRRRQEQITEVLNSYPSTPVHRGRFTSRSKLTEADVKIIKQRLATGETARSIASDFPVSHYAIWDIKSGKTWDYVKSDGL